MTCRNCCSGDGFGVPIVDTGRCAGCGLVGSNCARLQQNLPCQELHGLQQAGVTGYLSCLDVARVQPHPRLRIHRTVDADSLAGWMSWAINPTGGLMPRTQALVVF